MEGSLQRSVPVHRQFGKVDTSRSDFELQRQTNVYGLQCGEPPYRDGSARGPSASGAVASADQGSQKQKLGRILEAWCAVARFRLYRL